MKNELLVGGINVPSTTVITSIGMLLISFLGGFMYYYVLDAHPKEEKKKQMGEVTSLLINFIIFIWLGKILVHLPKFMKDPLAILAYPSDSGAFYLAVLFTLLNLLYRKIRHKQKLLPLFHVFVPVFMVASFLYEFFQFAIKGDSSNWFYLSFTFLFVISYALLQDKIKKTTLTAVMMLLWAIVQGVLSLIFSYVTLFTYMISPLFFLSVFIFIFVMMLYNRKGKVSS